MKKATQSLFLLGWCIVASAAGQALSPAAGGWVDSNGKFYPGGGPNVAIDQDTGEALLVTGTTAERIQSKRKARAPELAPRRPEITSCQQLQQEVASMWNALENMNRDSPQYSQLYYRHRAYEHAYVQKCE